LGDPTLDAPVLQAAAKGLLKEFASIRHPNF
jgi:hypothetical protein